MSDKDDKAFSLGGMTISFEGARSGDAERTTPYEEYRVPGLTVKLQKRTTWTLVCSFGGSQGSAKARRGTPGGGLDE